MKHHTMLAIVFSIAGYTDNFIHDISTMADLVGCQVHAGNAGGKGRRARVGAAAWMFPARFLELLYPFFARFMHRWCQNNRCATIN
jgi:hypothetical protein